MVYSVKQLRTIGGQGMKQTVIMSIIVVSLAACSGGGEANKGTAERTTQSSDASVEDTIPHVADEDTCWIAISGAYFGFGEKASKADAYQTTFPRSSAGDKVSAGASFDTVGGVFLPASKKGYEYRKGGRELDKAIDEGLDAMAIAPGMKVIVRDERGSIVYQGTGPDMFLSSEGDAQLAWLAGKFRNLAGSMPTWMKRYLEERNYQLRRIPLHDAFSMSVKRMEGSECN